MRAAACTSAATAGEAERTLTSSLGAMAAKEEAPLEVLAEVLYSGSLEVPFPKVVLLKLLWRFFRSLLHDPKKKIR